MAPKVFIIILNWNGLKDTLECLESVFKVDYPNFQVIVVDNGSTDESVAIIRKTCPQVILIENKENLGYTGGNNIGMRYAMDNGADYVWLLNNDTVVESDTLGNLVNAAEAQQKIGLISPVVYYYELPERIQFCGSRISWKNFAIEYPKIKNLDMDNFKAGTDVCLWGTALLIKRAVIDKIGYLNEKFFSYWEDTDYSMRSLEAGFLNKVETFSRIYHKHQSPEAKLPQKGIHYYFFMARNEFLLWTQFVQGLEKLRFSHKYLVKVIGETAGFRYFGNEVADAYFDGAWAAFRGIGGSWDKSVKIPFILKKIFSWHPYFWASLLQGNISHIASEALKRTKAKILKIAS